MPTQRLGNAFARLQRPPPVTLNSNDSDLLQVDGPGDSGILGRTRNLTPTSPLSPYSPESRSPLSRNLSPSSSRSPISPRTPISPGASSTYTASPITPVFPGAAHSQERLIPPSAIPNRFREYNDNLGSRRSSWDSLNSNDHRYGPYGAYNPFSDSRTNSRPTSPERYRSTDNLSDSIGEKYNIAPTEGGIYDGPEADDDLHDPTKKDDLRDCALFSRRGAVNIGGMVLIVLGLLALFIGYPILWATLELCEEKMLIGAGLLL